MNNEDFFDILGGLSDDIIADAALIPDTAGLIAENKNEEASGKNESLPTPIKRHRGTIKNMLLIAAAVAVFVISGFVIADSIKTGNMGLFETEKQPYDTTLSSVPEESASEESTSSYLENTTSENLTTNLYVPPPATEEPMTEEPTGGLTATPEPSTQEPPMLLPPDNAGEENSTDEPTEGIVLNPAPPPETESTTGNGTEGLLPPWLENLFPQMGDSSMGDGWFFLTATVLSFYEKLPEKEIDNNKYPVKENITGYELEKLFGTKIIPSFIPSSSGPNLDSSPDDEVLSKEYSVYYSSDKSSSFMSEEFTVPAKNGSTLKIKVSTEPLSLYSSEKEYIDNKSVINDVPVLLLCSKVLSRTVYLNAYFEKDGLYFRVIWQGKDLSEKEFIEILKSMM